MGASVTCLEGYVDVSSPVAYSSNSLTRRFALSYANNGWELTANVIWGINFDQVTSHPQTSPCPVSPAFPSTGCNPNFVNVDLTATKRFGKWELGPVGYYSSDLLSVLRAMAIAGLGVALIPDHFCREELNDRRLVRLLPDWCKQPGLVHVVFTTKRGLTPAVRALIDHLVIGFKEDHTLAKASEFSNSKLDHRSPKT